METALLFKDKKSFDPRKVSDKILIDDHRILHFWWGHILRGRKFKDWSKEDVWNAHKLCAEEMTRRGLGVNEQGKHASPLPTTVKELKYDQPFPSWKRDSNSKNPPLFLSLQKLLKGFEGDFKIAEDFVTLVGGICNHGSTKGDIDIVVNMDAKELMRRIGFRLARTLSKVGIEENRLQLLIDKGPFTNHVHLFDLVLVRKKKLELHEMSFQANLPYSERIQAELSELSKKITPFRFFIQPKPLHGRYKEEIYSPETVVKVVNNIEKWREALDDKGILVEKKFDGVRCQVHKVNNKIKIMTEEGSDVTSKLPTLAKQFLADNDNYVAEFELELWKEGEHQNRADTSASLHVKGVSPDEDEMLANIYDVLWWNGKDIHESPYTERHKLFSNIKGKNIQISKVLIATNTKDLMRAVREVSDLPGSEGAIIKLPTYTYPLKAHTTDMIKFKNEFTIKAKVTEVHHVKDSEARNYLCVIENNTPVGRTYNTLIKADKGDLIEVIFVNLNKYTDPKTKKVWYNFWAPRVKGTTDKITSLKEAEALVKKTSGEVEEKAFPTRYKDLSDIIEFERFAVIEMAEEFDISLQNRWIANLFQIPVFVSSKELRNEEGYLIKTEQGNKSMIMLRDKENKITDKKIVEAIECG